MESNEYHKSDDRQFLFDFWQEVPVIALIPPPTFDLIDSHPLRNAMIVVMRQGIIDPDTGMRRYAMNLKEMIDPIATYLEDHNLDSKSPNLTTLYHHRDLLLEHDLIQEVATFLEGKRYVTYYGRTARAFIGDLEVKKDKDQIRNQLHQIIIYLNPNVDSDEVFQNIDRMIEDRTKTHDRVKTWIETHVDMLNKLDLDAIQLYELITEFIKFDEDILKVFHSYLKL